MLGVLANSFAVLLGGVIGMLCGSRIKSKYTDSLMVALGLATMGMGVASTVGTTDVLCIIVCCSLGTVLGELTVTGSDQDNLVACQVARDHFHAKKVISRVNDPRNIETFQVLGIGNTACSTEILTKMIEQEADLAHMHLIATLNQGKAGICSMTLPSNTALDGVALKDIDLPGGTLVISLIRRGVLTIPNGSTTLQAGDELVAVSEERSQKALMRALAETVR